MFMPVPSVLPHIKAGRLNALAVGSAKRHPSAADVPTLTEARPGSEFPTTWFGLFTQAGVPRPIVEKVARDVDRIMAEPALRKRMYTERAVEPAPQRLDDFARFIRDERKLAQQMAKESGVEPN